MGDGMNLTNIPVGSLGIIAMSGCEEISEKINRYLVEWRSDRHISAYNEAETDDYKKTDYRIEAHCPRFGTGEAKGLISHSVRGTDLFIIVDVFNHGITYKMYGQNVPMSPDDHYQDLKRIISAAQRNCIGTSIAGECHIIVAVSCINFSVSDSTIDSDFIITIARIY